MSSHNPHSTFSVPADAAIALYTRVTITGGKAVAAGTGRSVGTVESVSTPDAVTGACTVGIRAHGGGTRWFIAGAAVAAGSQVTGIAAGKIDDTAVVGAEVLGIALEAAGADGDIIEVAAFGTSVVTA